MAQQPAAPKLAGIFICRVPPFSRVTLASASHPSPPPKKLSAIFMCRFLRFALPPGGRRPMSPPRYGYRPIYGSKLPKTSAVNLRNPQNLWITNVVLQFQSIEQIDEPRRQAVCNPNQLVWLSQYNSSSRLPSICGSLQTIKSQCLICPQLLMAVIHFFAASCLVRSCSSSCPLISTMTK